MSKPRYDSMTLVMELVRLGVRLPSLLRCRRTCGMDHIRENMMAGLGHDAQINWCDWGNPWDMGQTTR